MRSTSATMRSVSSQISWVSSRAGRVGVLFEQLRRAANAGKRVLDLVRQHRRHRGHRAGGVPMGQLAVHLVGHRPLVQRQHQQVGPLPRQRALDRHRTRRNARPFERHVVFGDRSAGAPYRVDQREDRAVRQQQLGELAADQRRGAGAEKLLGRRVDEAHDALAVEREDRARQGGEQQRGIGQRRRARARGRRASALQRRDHAPPSPPPCPPPIAGR